MILKDNLYTVAAIDREGLRADIALCPGCIIYEAHFPGSPVTPGVCIVQAAVELLGLLLGCGCTLVEVSGAKFLHVISPQDMPRVSYVFTGTEFSEGGSLVKARVAVTEPVGGKTCAKLSILCRAS